MHACRCKRYIYFFLCLCDAGSTSQKKTPIRTKSGKKESDFKNFVLGKPNMKEMINGKYVYVILIANLLKIKI